MTNKSIGISDELAKYVVEVGVREPDVLARLRAETAAMPNHQMQIAPEQGAFLALLVQLVGARRCIEVGTFTGYSSTAVALALPADGRLLCCDVSEEWTSTARKYWVEAGVADKVELRVAPAAQTLDELLAQGEESTYDFAFVDADKAGYDGYYERLLRLVRPGGLIALDNTLWGGRVLDSDAEDEDTRAIQALNVKLAGDERVSLSLVPMADGVTLARRR
ncbi:MAG TPA: class I SAM-dependent methyltransferase [Nocardioides sp.]|uniref:class I SAM-dependent methyltransferase n=1 Tax=Nocardioides sp. TaxID=35761 RepID=UPI002D7E704A|nr:class I SAM-dependent methyltransferase [Nocardioides sp.]HET6651056.1 class I SAM-dependent methyltransferase [Nocardioides sp.]